MTLPTPLATRHIPGQRTVPHSILRLPRAAGVGVVLVSALVLVGWGFDSERLKRVIPGAVAMNPMTAVAFILSSVGLWLLGADDSDASRLATRRRAAFVCAATVALIGLVRLVGYAARSDPGLDRLLFSSELATAGGDQNTPNRIAPNTALNFLFSGSALLLSISRKNRLEWLTQGMLFFTVFSSFVAPVSWSSGWGFSRPIPANVPWPSLPARTWGAPWPADSSRSLC